MPLQHTKKRKQKTINEEPLNKGDFVIPVMGKTGAGKSTFINKLLGEERLSIGHDMDSCTSKPTPVVIDSSRLPPGVFLTNRRLVLLDTPGFDETYRQDSVILKQIADWLKAAYDQKAVVGGVVYLHDITHDRFTCTAKQNLETFRRLCGTDSLGKVVIGTTKWGKLVEPKEGKRREDYMINSHWKPLIAKGTKVRRVSDNPWMLVRDIIEGNTGIILQIQREMAVENKEIQETEAGIKAQEPKRGFFKRLFKIFPR